MTYRELRDEQTEPGSDPFEEVGSCSDCGFEGEMAIVAGADE